MADASLHSESILGYPVYDRTPDGCIVHLIGDDDSFPILRAGDFVVVDKNQCEPDHAELFLMEYERAYEKVLVVKQLNRRLITWSNKPASDGWWAVAYNRPRTKEQAEALVASRGVIRCADGPYRGDGESYEYLKSKIVGKVVGIFQSDFDETRLVKVN